MSSNVGLTTPRGSGTSGYVQRNLSHLKPRDNIAPYPKDFDQIQTQRQRQPDKEILEHERKREVEVKCFELRDSLEEEGIDEEEIEERVDKLRAELLAKLAASGGAGPARGGKGLKAHQVHDLAAVKIAENERIQKALGISPDYEEGSHWKKQADRRRERELGDGSGNAQ